jgi:hypothetical protein
MKIIIIKIERRRKMYFNQEIDTDSFFDDFLKKE